jgi:hypothetical protein
LTFRVSFKLNSIPASDKGNVTVNNSDYFYIDIAISVYDGATYYTRLSWMAWDRSGVSLVSLDAVGQLPI